MIISEKEAQTKFCPMTFAAQAFQDMPGKYHCVGSDCMWWKWKTGDWATKNKKGEYIEGECGAVK